MLNPFVLGAVAIVLTASNAVAAELLRYDRGEITFNCGQVAVKDMNSGREEKKPETFMLMYFPNSGILQGADQFVPEYPEGGMATTERQADMLSGTFNIRKGPGKFGGTVKIIARQAGDEYDNGKITLEKIPFSFTFTTIAESDGRNETLSYRGFCASPKYEFAAGSGSVTPAPKLEPGCFTSNGEKFCK
ncbi:hypothetical protein BH10PSE11_BH10PSE11_06240 [soil metagenome]